MKWKNVTDDEWAEHCIQFRCHGTEPDKSLLVHVHGATGVKIGRVKYWSGGAKTYSINEDAATEIVALGSVPMAQYMPSNEEFLQQLSASTKGA